MQQRRSENGPNQTARNKTRIKMKSFMDSLPSRLSTAEGTVSEAEGGRGETTAEGDKCWEV